MQPRARSSEDKERRTEDLLAAAAALGHELGGVRHVTASAVAKRAGLDPSGLRRYFASREELLLELAERGWQHWRAAIRTALAAHLPPDHAAAAPDAAAGAGRVEAGGTGTGRIGPGEVARVISRTISGLPLFCDLLTHVPLSLEGDVDLERARRYKTSSFAAYDELVADLAGASTMPAAQIAELITVALGLTAYLWQLAHPTPTLAALYAQVPRWGHVAVDFEPRLTRLLEAAATGLTTP